MKVNLMDIALDALNRKSSSPEKIRGPESIKKVNKRGLSYTERHRGNWFAPEYDFAEIQIAQDTDAYLFRAIQKKVNRVITAGFSFVGNNPETVAYVEQRIAEIEWATQGPLFDLVSAIFHDLFRFSNCMVIKSRNAAKSSGQVRKGLNGETIEPVAGYFVLPFETLEFKTKANGELKKVGQIMPDGTSREFFPRDIVHFYTNRKPGFVVGTPEILPALDDLALLRRIEENIEDLIEANLFPVFHYQVGSDDFPERAGPDGVKETDIVKRTLEYMPAGGIYVSDHRHQIKSVGSEGKSLRIDYYVDYFKKRVFAALGVSPIDMGEGGDANRSTASTLSKGMLMDIEAMTVVVKNFIEFYMIRELLIEGGFNPLDPHQQVHMKFGVIDKEERRADENQQVQLWLNNLKTMQEARKAIGERPFREEDLDLTHYKMFQEPLALLKSLPPGNVAAQALAEHISSSITEEQVEANREEQAAADKGGRPESKTSGTVQNLVQPANQHGARASAKTTSDSSISIVDKTGNVYTLTCNFEVNADKVSQWQKQVQDRAEVMNKFGVSFETVAENMLWRLEENS